MENSFIAYTPSEKERKRDVQWASVWRCLSTFYVEHLYSTVPVKIAFLFSFFFPRNLQRNSQRKYFVLHFPFVGGLRGWCYGLNASNFGKCYKGQYVSDCTNFSNNNLRGKRNGHPRKLPLRGPKLCNKRCFNPNLHYLGSPNCLTPPHECGAEVLAYSPCRQTSSLTSTENPLIFQAKAAATSPVCSVFPLGINFNLHARLSATCAANETKIIKNYL